MYTVSPELYEEVAVRLCDAIDGENYFSGSIAFQYDEVACRLTTSVIVYRRHASLPEGESHAITDLVPVWWEFHTSDEGGEQLNDFSFTALRSRLV